MKKKTFLIISLLSTCFFFSQKKKLTTFATQNKITIDGIFDEPDWQKCDIAKDFIMINPDNGKPEDAERKTEVRILYDNACIYVAATLFDSEPNKIMKEFVGRDNFGTADHFGIFINGYNDGQQEFRFFVSAVGVQQDLVYTPNGGEDITWNAIWDSKVKTTDIGWQVEMKIPYAALRFPPKSNQVWGLNFYREVQRIRSQYSWNRINNNINNEANQAGTLEGIQNINTPTRLFFIPYISDYVNASDAYKTYNTFKAGLDLKYGLNDAFTLDAILVPDFGQTKFDNVVLNLGPFEQQFNENRPFFTEGTDLFNKSGLVYSRRIGGEPNYWPEMDDDEEIDKYPKTTNLINALKLSGRTEDGMGIGILNAITARTYAEIKNTNTEAIRKALVEPLVNYNVLVLDQRFRKNSSVTFTNTNVSREGQFRDANVTALNFDLNTKKNTYKLSGSFKASSIQNPSNELDTKGFCSGLTFADTSGKWRYGFSGSYFSDNYDPNDLGINFYSHYHSFTNNFSYQILNPTKKLNYFNTGLESRVEIENRSGKIQNYYHNYFINLTTTKNDSFGFGFFTVPVKTYDFYEPRSFNDLKFLTISERYNPWGFFSSNYNRKFAFDAEADYTAYTQKGRSDLIIGISPRYRFSNKFSLVYAFKYIKNTNNVGWVDFSDDDTIMTNRNITSYNNSITGKFAINNVMTINLLVRHYFSYTDNHAYYNLQNDGSILENPNYITNKNSSLNLWNFDLSYSWWFAANSQISLLYRNNAAIFTRKYSTDYFNNTENALNDQHLNHLLSFSIRYYIDYNQAKNWFSK